MEVLRSIAAAPFRIVVGLRNRAYDAGLLRSTRLPVPVLSVGNISVGGTGKTPVVDYLAGRLLEQELRVAVVTRGYGRATRGTFVVSDGAGTVSSAAEGGDEPVQLALRHPSLVVIADELRTRGGTFAVDSFNAEILLLDDGFQHRACARDLDIVLLDASIPWEGLQLLPAGRLREPPSHLRRADVVLLTRCRDVEGIASLRENVALHTDAPVIATRFEALELRTLDGMRRDLVEVAGRSAVAFCGIGNPHSFRRTLSALDLHIEMLVEFSDHHPFSTADVRKILDHASRYDTQLLITTEKDAARLGGLADIFKGMELMYVRVGLSFLDDAQTFHDAVDGAIQRGRSRSDG